MIYVAITLFLSLKWHVSKQETETKQHTSGILKVSKLRYCVDSLEPGIFK